MTKILTYLSVAIILSGIAGVIGHSVSFSSQSSNMTNTYSASWFAAVFAISGFNLLHLVKKPAILRKLFWFELVVIILSSCALFIALVCVGYSQDWPSFAWVLVTFIPIIASAIHLLKFKNGSVSDERQTQTVTSKVITVSISLFKVVFLLIVSLLASGSILSAIAYSYPAPGRPISVFFDGANRNGTLQLYCIGTSSISKPTVFIFSSAAHGIVDLYGLQYFLSTSNGTNRRVCVHDPLGFGWSQDPFNGQFTNYEYLYRLMLASEEPMPWHIVGWGGGGSAVMYLANNHTYSIKSVTFVETYPPGIEFSYYGYQNGLSPQAISEYRSAQLSSRAGLVQVILAMAIPWGLMGLFIPLSPRDENYYPPERWAEFRVQMWKSKVWISQYQGVQNLQASSDSNDALVTFAPLPSQIPVFGVYCNVTVACQTQNQNAKDCTERKDRNAYYDAKKFAMIRSINTNATIAENLDDDCNLNLPVQKPAFTATSILRHYSGIGA